MIAGAWSSSFFCCCFNLMPSCIGITCYHNHYHPPPHHPHHHLLVSFLLPCVSWAQVVVRAQIPLLIGSAHCYIPVFIMCLYTPHHPLRLLPPMHFTTTANCTVPLPSLLSSPSIYSSTGLKNSLPVLRTQSGYGLFVDYFNCTVVLSTGGTR